MANVPIKFLFLTCCILFQPTTKICVKASTIGPPEVTAGQLTTSMSSATTTTTTAGCDCSQCPGCQSLDQCRADGTNSSEIYDECVVKAELYAKCDGCCPDTMVCGVVVTLRNDSRWLIHDRLCDDNKCEMVVIDASCMSSDWKSFTETKIIVSGVADYIQAGNSVYIGGLNNTDCSESCKRMMNLT